MFCFHFFQMLIGSNFEKNVSIKNRNWPYSPKLALWPRIGLMAPNWPYGPKLALWPRIGLMALNWSYGPKLALWPRISLMALNWPNGFKLALWLQTGLIDLNWPCTMKLALKPQIWYYDLQFALMTLNVLYISKLGLTDLNWSSEPKFALEFQITYMYLKLQLAFWLQIAIMALNKPYTTKLVLQLHTCCVLKKIINTKLINVPTISEHTIKFITNIVFGLLLRTSSPKLNIISTYVIITTAIAVFTLNFINQYA